LAAAFAWLQRLLGCSVCLAAAIAWLQRLLGCSMMPKLDVVNVVSILISAQARPGASLAVVIHSSVRGSRGLSQEPFVES
jgi:hypothetical protein